MESQCINYKVAMAFRDAIWVKCLVNKLSQITDVKSGYICHINNLRHFTLYLALINKRAGVHSLTLYTHSIESKAISLSPISKIAADLNCPDVDKLFVQHSMVSKCDNC